MADPSLRKKTGGKYAIVKEDPSMSVKKFHLYYGTSYPKCARVVSGSLVAMKTNDTKGGVIVPGECFIILSSKMLRYIKIQGAGNQLTLAPITSETEFALIPNDDRNSETILGKKWEGIYTDILTILELGVLPPALYVRSDCSDHKKKKVRRDTMLYNIKPVSKTIKKKIKRGIEGMSSDGTTYTFLEAEPVDFSSKQIDTKRTLYWFSQVVQFPQRARVFAGGACDIPGISNHSEVTFVDRGSDELLVVKKLGEKCPIMYINDNSDVKVAAVTLENYEEYDQILKGRGIQSSTPPPRTPSKESTYVNLGSLRPTPGSTSSPRSWNPNHYYENYTPRNERDYYNEFESKAGKRLGGQTSQSSLVHDESEDEHYSLVDEFCSNHGDRGSKLTPKYVSGKKSSTDSEPQGGLLQASIPSLSDRPSEIHLRHYITDKMGKDWERLATYLGLDYSCVEQIKQDLDNVEAQCFRVLIEWLRGKGEEPKTWEVLLKKLDSSGRKDISGEIREKIENGTLNEF